MSKSEIQNNFLLNYGWSPSADEKVHFERFCDGIATQETLEKVLNPDNHPASKNGRRYQPNIATLYALKDKIIREMYDFSQATSERDFQAEFDAETDGWGCLYCCDGDVWDLVWTGKRYSLETIGRCKRCRQGDAEVRPEIIAKVETSKIPAARIAGAIFMGLYTYRWKTGGELPQEALTRFLGGDG